MLSQPAQLLFGTRLGHRGQVWFVYPGKERWFHTESSSLEKQYSVSHEAIQLKTGNFQALELARGCIFVPAKSSTG
jgi:hypothetical protein